MAVGAVSSIAVALRYVSSPPRLAEMPPSSSGMDARHPADVSVLEDLVRISQAAQAACNEEVCRLEAVLASETAARAEDKRASDRLSGDLRRAVLEMSHRVGRLEGSYVEMEQAISKLLEFWSTTIERTISDADRTDFPTA
jgi:hypothetical protein